MASIFTKIISGEIPSFKIYEDDNYLAFLDINPNALGHTLCIPKKEINEIFDLDDETLSGLMIFSKKVAHAIKKAVVCKRVGVSIIGLEVPHVHVHLIPINKMNDMSFESKINLTQDEFIEIMKKIKSYI
ncbi:MAG: HIT domain-containing protein [Cryomorphaceae bacterium]|jgi:histidine triad (HIT) family protein|nr:HIT domain-containing protein [Cryomorphaceae bacterium]MBT3503800.1 HIT domain-containing protein [Cryomorphaceae bacterium]MBT3689455.1 HIT domain-containing protein [Cryomorphaceae bacterium]MBT4221572.1 HIT domain-containing protein [Cryomorphaceae bacterium]MBT4293150.1 HIT domain-containing protein [Cryomorphaceae bacterium]|tara:strand:+ start:504 stop:893 length:390 start_codon:yes stop_codon:yes gene_type:complete